MAKISPKQYAQTLFEITKNKDRKEIDRVVVRFVEQLAKNGHMKYAAQVIDAFEKIYNAHNHIVKAHVTTAAALTDAQKATIMQKITHMFGAEKAEVRYSEDQKIIGGIVIQVGDEVIDASVQKRLRTLERQLTSL